MGVASRTELTVAMKFGRCRFTGLGFYVGSMLGEVIVS